jgi:hypothetical protein
VVSLQSGSGHLTTVLSNLAIYFAQFAPEPPPVPASFDELCTIVEQVEGVRFRELFERLPRRVASGDEALQAVVALAMEQAKRMAEEEKEEGEKG